MTVDAILFDCDGVLVDSEVVGLEDTTEYLRSLGFPWSPRDLIRLFTGKRDDRFKAELLSHYADLLGRPPTDEEGEALFTEMLEIRRAKRHTMQAVPGALDTIKLVHERGLPMAVASSSRKVYLDSKVERYGFAPFVLPHVYSAEHVAHGKPAPDIFLHSAKRLRMEPHRCLVIEDSPAGVEAGVAAGMQVWGFTGGGHCLDDHAQRLIKCGALRVHSDHVALQQDLIRVIEEH